MGGGLDIPHLLNTPLVIASFVYKNEVDRRVPRNAADKRKSYLKYKPVTAVDAAYSESQRTRVVNSAALSH